jgi:hypothetical protein
MSTESNPEQSQSVRQELLAITGNICKTEGCDTGFEPHPLGMAPDDDDSSFVTKYWISPAFAPGLRLGINTAVFDPSKVDQDIYEPLGVILTIYNLGHGEYESLRLSHPHDPQETLNNDPYAQYFLETFQSFAVHPHEICMQAIAERQRQQAESL